MIVGDPCVVWDDAIAAWRMFLFALPPGHAHATCRSPANPLAGGAWGLEGPLEFSNPEALLGEAAYKPWVVMDPWQPNRAARIDGRYALLMLTNVRNRFVQRAWSDRLAGPWELEEQPLITTGPSAAFDSRHVDAVTGYWFAARGALLYFYMGMTAAPQPRAVSAYGSAQGVAVERWSGHRGKSRVEKLGPVLEPCQSPGHWASGWVGGLQILPGAEHPWIAVVNASPTLPDPEAGIIGSEEPAPSLGGFAWCGTEWPVEGWHWTDEPIEWTRALPPEALATGEGENFWRHHLLVLDDGRLALLYNSGAYGQEQLYGKVTEPGFSGPEE